MAITAVTIDITSHPVNAIVALSNGAHVKFPKVKPAGGGDATDAAWQTRAQVEHLAAINAAMSGKSANSTAYLASMA